MDKRNLPYQITYLLEIILVLLGAVFYRQPLLSVLLLLLVLLPPISILFTRYQINKLSINAFSKCRSVTKNGIINIVINTKYNSFIPLLNCKVKMTYENLFYPHNKIQEFVFPADTKGKGEYIIPFKVTKAGMFVLNANQINITDYLHLYTFSRPLNIKVEIPLLPEEISTPYYEKKRVTTSQKDREPTEITTMGGEKTRDLKQLREYQPGDRIKDIHWSLTAKTDEIMVREFEEYKELYYLLFPILTSSENMDDKEDKLQDTLDVFYSIGKDLLKQNEPFTTAIYNSLDSTFSLSIVTDENELYEALFKLYGAKIEGYDRAYEKYVEHFSSNTDGIIIIENGKVSRKGNM